MVSRPGSDRSAASGLESSWAVRASATRPAIPSPAASRRVQAVLRRRGAHDEAPVLVGQQDRRSVGVEHLAEAREQGGEHVVQPVVRERRVEEELEAVHDAGHLLGFLARCLLADELDALLRVPEALRQIVDERGDHVLPTRTDPLDGHLDRDQAAVATLQLGLADVGLQLPLGTRKISAEPFDVRLDVLPPDDDLAGEPADRLLGGEPEHPLRGGVPHHDPPLPVEGDERIRGTVDDRPHSRLAHT
jgi:hypothetical protein